MTIKEAIETYNREKTIESEAKKKAEAAKKFILSFMGDNENIVTDAYTVTLKKTSSFRLDTEALYKDFPDIKETYGKTTVSKSLIVQETGNEKTLTA